MKSFSEIEQEINTLDHNLRIAERQHSALDQISMLSSEGSGLREKINKMKGAIRALNWVKNNNLTGNVYDME